MALNGGNSTLDLLSDLLTISTTLSYSKEYFVSLYDFGSGISVYPVNLIFVGIRLELNLRGLWEFRYKYAFSGGTKYNDIDFPIHSQVYQVKYSRSIYKQIGMSLIYRNYTITSTQFVTINNYSQLFVDINYQL